jgi:hypothetical protein
MDKMSLAVSLLALVAFAPQKSTIEVPFRIGEDAIILDAVVNGRPASFMFDTGFSGAIVLNDSINIGAPTGEMGLRDFVGQFTAKTVKIKTLKLGDLSVDTSEMEAVQQPLAHMTESYNTHTDGIMGLEVIRKQITEINFEKKKFIFHPKGYDITAKKADGVKTFLVKMLPMGMSSIELSVLAPSGKRMILALDTGNAFYATTHKDVLERVGMWESGRTPQFMTSSWVASGPVDSWYKEMKDMKIFGVPVPTSYWSIIDLPSSSAEHDGTVGFGFLKNFNITFDYDKRLVYLENFTGKVENEMAAEIGVTALTDPRDGRVKIFRVAPKGPAAKAGLKEGDHILAIEGEDLRNPTYRQIQKLLEGPENSKVKLAISRAGNLMRFEVTREMLVNR